MCHDAPTRHGTPFEIFLGRDPHQSVKILQHFRNRLSPWNGEFLHLDAAVSPRRFYWILSLKCCNTFITCQCCKKTVTSNDII